MARGQKKTKGGQRVGDPARLTDVFVSSMKNKGTVFDAERTGLFVRVRRRGGTPRFYQRIRIGGTRRELALGAYGEVSLTQARDVARENQRIARAGGDPALARPAASPVPTFAQALDQTILLRRQAWREGGKSEAQWRASMRDYVLPTIGHLPVCDVGVGHVLTILGPIWIKRAETATRVLQRIVMVMRWAVAAGHLEHNVIDPEVVRAGLPRRRPAVTHFRALPYAKVAAGLRALRASGAHPATALCAEWQLLTAVRPSEARLAEWSEVDEARGVWLLSGGRRKTGDPLRVALASDALRVLAEAKLLQGRVPSPYLFPVRGGLPLSADTLRQRLVRLGIDTTPHGLRSAFGTWAIEGGISKELADGALGHKCEDPYFRTDLLEQRRAVMQRWSDYLSLRD